MDGNNCKSETYTTSGYSQVKSQHETKYLDCYFAICELDGTRNRLQKLMDRIQSSVQPSSDKPPSTVEEEPSLLKFLNETPEKVQKLNADIRSMISNIEEMLF